jgi:hypothetical protein
LDFLPEEGDAAVFYQDWFFAKPDDSRPRYRQKVRIVTESLPIERAQSSYWEGAESEE